MSICSDSDYTSLFSPLSSIYLPVPPHLHPISSLVSFFSLCFHFPPTSPSRTTHRFTFLNFSTLSHPSSNNSNQTIQLTLVNFNINPKIKFSFNYLKQIMEQNRRYSDLVYITNVLSSHFASAIPTQRFQ